jgi:hypothetical protein
MNDEVIIDYAKPCMDAEKALKDAHEAVLNNDLALARTKAMDAIIAARLMYGALGFMEMQADMIRSAQGVPRGG